MLLGESCVVVCVWVCGVCVCVCVVGVCVWCACVCVCVKVVRHGVYLCLTAATGDSRDRLSSEGSGV